MKPENRTLPREWCLVTLEETAYWNLPPGFKGARVFTTYVFDDSARTYLCEPTPSVCLHPVETFAHLDGLEDEEREALAGIVDAHAESDVTYLHASSVQQLEVRALGWTSDPDEGDAEDLERVLEYCRGNGVGFIPGGCRVKPRALSTLKREAARAARFRGHVIAWGADFPRGAGRACNGSCRCGAWVSIEQTPAPNGVDVGGTAVAVSCPENATLRDRRGRPTPQGFACGHVEAREDGRGRVTLWREHGCYHVTATPNGPGPVQSAAGGTLREMRRTAARFWRDLLRGPDSGTLSADEEGGAS